MNTTARFRREAAHEVLCDLVEMSDEERAGGLARLAQTMEIAPASLLTKVVAEQLREVGVIMVMPDLMAFGDDESWRLDNLSDALKWDLLRRCVRCRRALRSSSDITSEGARVQ